MQTETNLAPISKITHWYPHIQLLRAFAALSVVVYHVIELFPWPDFPKTAPLLWFRVGWMGVDLFFVISGFVIMLSALMLWDKDAHTARRHFMLRRIFRIAPLYILTCIVFLVIEPSAILAPDAAQHVLTHLLFIHNWWVTTHGSINGPNWSVAAEFQFYIVVWIFMPQLVRMRISTMIILFLLVAWGCRALTFEVAEYLGWAINKRFTYATQMPSMLDLFAFGMVLAKLLHTKKAQLQAMFASWNRYWVALIATMVLSGLFANYSFWQHAGDYWMQEHMVVFWRTALGIPFLCLLAVCVLAPSHWGQKNLFYRAGSYLGEISYGLYLWHMPSLLFLKTYNIASPLWFLAAVLSLTFALSALSWHLLEKPCMGWAKRKTA